jgi:hypothetical protein
VISNTYEEEYEVSTIFRKKNIKAHGAWAKYFGLITTLTVTVTIDT